MLFAVHTFNQDRTLDSGDRKKKMVGFLSVFRPPYGTLGNNTAECECRAKNLSDLNLLFWMIKSPVNHLDDGNAKRPDVHLKSVV